MGLAFVFISLSTFVAYNIIFLCLVSKRTGRSRSFILSLLSVYFFQWHSTTISQKTNRGKFAKSTFFCNLLHYNSSGCGMVLGIIYQIWNVFNEVLFLGVIWLNIFCRIRSCVILSKNKSHDFFFFSKCIFGLEFSLNRIFFLRNFCWGGWGIT